MKKMKYKLFKKIEAFALAGCMILSFSGCGDKTETQEKKLKLLMKTEFVLGMIIIILKATLIPNVMT